MKEINPQFHGNCETMFSVPDWMIGVSEMIFLFLYIVWPCIYIFFGNLLGLHGFTNTTQAFLTSMLFQSLIQVFTSCLMDIVIFFWPRASKIQGKYLSEGAAHEWSTVVDIFITPHYFKPVSLSLSRSSLF